jgi:hypothetical protein
VNPKIAGKWMFIPLKMVLIGIDPYPYETQINPACFAEKNSTGPIFFPGRHRVAQESQQASLALSKATDDAARLDGDLGRKHDGFTLW